MNVLVSHVLKVNSVSEWRADIITIHGSSANMVSYVFARVRLRSTLDNLRITVSNEASQRPSSSSFIANFTAGLTGPTSTIMFNSPPMPYLVVLNFLYVSAQVLNINISSPPLGHGSPSVIYHTLTGLSNVLALILSKISGV